MSFNVTKPTGLNSLSSWLCRNKCRKIQDIR